MTNIFIKKKMAITSLNIWKHMQKRTYVIAYKPSPVAKTAPFRFCIQNDSSATTAKMFAIRSAVRSDDPPH